MVVNILKSPELDPKASKSFLDTKGCSNCIRHLAKTLLTCFTTSVVQKWNGLAKRIFKYSSKKPAALKASLRDHFNEVRPSNSQIKLDPLFWYNHWCYYGKFFDSLLNFSRPLKFTYSESPRSVSLRFDSKDLKAQFPEVDVLRELERKMNLTSPIRSILLTKYGQFKVLTKRVEKPSRKRPPSCFLKKCSKELIRLLKIAQSNRSHISMKTKCKDNFSVVVADPGQKNIFEGLTLNFGQGHVKIEPFRLTATRWRHLSGTSDLIHSWNQALKRADVRKMPIALRQRCFYRYQISYQKRRQRALDTICRTVFKVPKG